MPLAVLFHFSKKKPSNLPSLVDKVNVLLCDRAVIGEVDEEHDNDINLADIKAEPLNPVLH